MWNKERGLKATRVTLKATQVTYNGKPIRTTADFPVETLKAQRVQSSILQVLKGHNSEYRLLCPAKLSSETVEEERKT